jgi:hypothetical protein
MRATMLLLLASCAAGPAPSEPRVMIEDFESGRARWKDAGSGWKKTEVEIVEGGVAGRRAARVTISGKGEGAAWSDLTWPVGSWPEGATHIVFWARAPKACRILVKVNLGPTHEDLEMWAAAVEVGVEWREIAVAVADLRERIWAHRQSPAVEPARIIGVGFVETDVPVTFEIDRIGIRGGKK